MLRPRRGDDKLWCTWVEIFESTISTVAHKLINHEQYRLSLLEWKGAEVYG